ncbi:MAG: GIY-YIG nuclease family protein [Acidobacteriota bacterium]
MTAAVYILSNRRGGVLYTGVTSDLERRVWQHQLHQDPSSFSARYNCNRLVYFEVTPDVEAAIKREKQIKGWLRRRKVALIEASNPEWRDLSAEWES